MKTRRPGLQRKWAYVVNSLQEIVPSYEQASSRISLFADRRMRSEAVRYAVTKESLVLDLGSGPGTMSKVVLRNGGDPVLLDVSRTMLEATTFENRVQAAFEYLPFRDGSFDAVVCGFALRDAEDLLAALGQVTRVLRSGGRFAFCDLGKPDSKLKMVAVAYYMRVIPNLVGLVTAGRAGLRYGSLYDTYVLTLQNSQLSVLLSIFFRTVRIDEAQMGGAIVALCRK